MKLVELLKYQRVTIQLSWGEEKIEFFANVLENDGTAVYVSTYLHNGSPLELNVTQGKGVICNIYTNDPSTKQRISWKNVELTTVQRNDEMMYCLRTKGFNHVAKHDERRLHERMVIQTKAKVFDGQSEDGVNIIVHDISDVGISFYAPTSFSPRVQQLVIVFSDYVDDRNFNVRVDCAIARITSKAGNTFVGCRTVGENRDYQLYCFVKRLKDKNKNERN